MQLETLKRLEDARLACVRIADFVSGVARNEFIASDLLRSAVERQVEIIGESLGRAAAGDSEVETRIPQLRKIVGMRNRLIHGYDEVDYNIVWDVITNHVPQLRRELEAVLSAGEDAR
jgi:uncharacterized protein with HEPN domain